MVCAGPPVVRGAHPMRRLRGQKVAGARPVTEEAVELIQLRGQLILRARPPRGTAGRMHTLGAQRAGAVGFMSRVSEGVKGRPTLKRTGNSLGTRHRIDASKLLPEKVTTRAMRQSAPTLRFGRRYWP